MRRPRQILRALLACLTLITTSAATFAQSTLAQTLEGSWLMEDLYTIHVDAGGVERIESHAPGAFVTEVEFRTDGSGRQGDRSFLWIHVQDEIQWRFEDGGTVSLLVRFLTPDYFLVFARALGQPNAGAAVSGLVRMR